MREIEVETFLKPTDNGISRPALVLGDDCKEYVLKNEIVNENGEIVNYDCMFLNELIAYQIGCYLEVPMPEVVIAIVDGNFINEDPSIRFAYRFEAGKYFATTKLLKVENNFLENCQDLIKMGKPYIERPWKKFFRDIENKDDIAKIVAFDLLIGNFDRYINTGNVLINKENARKIYAIDHGHAFFGPKWETNKINCLAIDNVTDKYLEFYASGILKEIRRSGQFGSGTIFGALEEHINLENVESHSFNDVILRIKDINEAMLHQWFDSIPKEWYIDKSYQVAHYTNFIMKQKFAVEYIIQILAEHNAFTNFRGGTLKYGLFKKENSL